MQLALLLPALIVAGVTACLLSWRLATARGRWQVYDIPNHRSLHTRPTPHTGGIAILTGAAAGLLTAWLTGNYLLLDVLTGLSLATLAGVALLDDRYHLNAALRLLIQVCVVAMILYVHPLPEVSNIALLVILLLMVWMINLYNFMDGMDGFAGGMAIIGFGAFAVIAWQTGFAEMALGCAIIAAACIGFLALNFPPARLFMGDVGSTVLGLLAGLVILQAHIKDILPFWLGVLIFSPFIVDASVTLGVRILRREPFWHAHKSHSYQRVVQLGWGHRRTVLAEYVLMVGCAGSAIWAAGLTARSQCLIIGLWAVTYLLLILIISRSQPPQGIRK